jgi:hypothetical protein
MVSDSIAPLRQHCDQTFACLSLVRSAWRNPGCKTNQSSGRVDILRQKRATFEDVVNTLAQRTGANDPNAASIRAELRQSLLRQSK